MIGLKEQLNGYKKTPRTEKEFVLMWLTLIYGVGVCVFAGIRYYRGELIIAALDSVLALFSLYIFVLVWKTRAITLPALAMAITSVIGTIATIALKGPEQVFWAYPSVALVFYFLPTRQAVILWSISAAVIVFQLLDLPVFKLVSIVITLFITSFFCHLFSSTMNEQHNRLSKLAFQDVLTQIKNRRAFNQATNQLEKFKGSVSSILLDLDNFKNINDFYGHAMGDEVLMAASAFVENELNNDGELYRIGGDEFAILCVGHDFNHAYQLAQQIYQSFGNSELNTKHGLTLSMSVAQKEHDESLKDWLGRLDSALYKAKMSGRNQIVKAVRY